MNITTNENMKFRSIDITLKNGASVQIREGRKEDAQELIDSMKAILRETEFLLVEEDEFSMTLEQEETWLATFNDVPTSLYLVATHENKIIGNMGIVGNRMRKLCHTASLGISIREKWQNLGLGKQMIEIGINWAKSETDLEIIWLEVFSSNVNAIPLYSKLGFVEEGRQKNFVKLRGNNYNDKITMSLQLKINQ